ncbi:MAG: patatin-like phospholipase family protein, partial [Synergistes sp.]|nr:patatin-like phospholipase family protein [Synergistes sp.]
MKRLTINGILLSVFILFFYAASASAEAVPSKGTEELKSPTASLDKSAALYSNIPLYVVSSDFGPDSNETKKHTRSWGFPHREGVVLVLCGGGMKGLSHVGVFEVLKRENIPVAAIVGTSMGAIMGGLYASGLSPEDIHAKLKDSDLMYIMSGRKNLEIYNNYNSPVPPGDSLISFTSNNGENQEGQLGLLNAKDVYSYLCDLTSHVSVTDFDYLPIPFAATATDLDNGDTVILRNGNLASAMRASMSFPIVFDPWPVNGRLLVDGGLKANLPVLEAKKLFPGHPIVAVNLSPLDISSNNTKFHSILDVAGQTVDILM